MTLTDLEFDNRFTTALPADPSDVNRPRQVHAAAFTRIHPTPVSSPRTVAVSDEMLELLGLRRADAATPEFAAVFSGNALLDAMDPFAMNYAGHQFGNWAGQLGDGRAIGLGEVVATDGTHQMLQLKGAGPTPYSRSADGRAVLRSSVREFLCSEAMHHLGEPTTRALSLVLTGDQVVRDMLYDGRPAPEPGGGRSRWQNLAACLKDCRTVLCSGAGQSPTSVLNANGIEVIMMNGMIGEALDAVYNDKPVRAPIRQHRCGTGCGLSLIHISEPTRRNQSSRMPSSA